jgi:ADP-ribosylglycohydrolase/8-oxo-dGTP pyrophosphatase MutT (NUDIX family)
MAAAGIIGLAVGDALGVPVEFFDRARLKREPVTGLRSFGTHHQPAGTWSDDTSLALCLAESLAEKGIDYDDQAQRFIAWKYAAKWTPHGRVFDIGNATGEAIARLLNGVYPLAAGPDDEQACGNGSLMRILPLAIFLADAEPAERWQIAADCSRLTHGHPRCQLACAHYVEVAAALVRGESLLDGIEAANRLLHHDLKRNHPHEQAVFARILSPQLAQLLEREISGSGYVIHCLEASLWCALRAKSYAEGVLAAVNLGDDTDTTGAVTGGLLGLQYGLAGIPAEWQNQLVRRADILALCSRLQAAADANRPRSGSSPMPPAELKTLYAGRHVSLVARGKWEFVKRNTNRPAVGIVAITGDEKVILVEQRRPAVDGTLIELPAGLAGDIAGAENEPLLDAAKRELLEETGYAADHWTELTSGYSSPGLTDEQIVLFLAEGVRKVAAGGGDASESIVVHEVPLGVVLPWLKANKFAADLKLLAGLYAAGEERQRRK